MLLKDVYSYMKLQHLEHIKVLNLYWIKWQDIWKQPQLNMEEMVILHH